MLPMQLPMLLEYVAKACSFKRVLTTGLLAESIVLLPPSLSQLSAGPPPTLDRAELTACQIADALMLPLFFGRVGTVCASQRGVSTAALSPFIVPPPSPLIKSRWRAA